MSPIRVVPYGDCALLITGLRPNQLLGTAWEIRRHQIEGVIEVVPAQESIAVLTTPLVCDMHSLADALLALVRADAAFVERRDVIIEVCYDGLDLEQVARMCAISVAEVVRRHTESNFEVEYLGFVPGFAYLKGLDEALSVPRLAEPRLSVPAGSVAIANRYGCVYPVQSPGGWRVLGTTTETLFDETLDPPARLKPGDRVRFVSW